MSSPLKSRYTSDDVGDLLDKVAFANRDDDELYDALQTVLGDTGALWDIAHALNGDEL